MNKNESKVLENTNDQMIYEDLKTHSREELKELTLSFYAENKRLKAEFYDLNKKVEESDKEVLILTTKLEELQQRLANVKNIADATEHPSIIRAQIHEALGVVTE